MSTRVRLVSIGAALGFGLLAGLVHGNDGGLRAAFGNLSAPWLFVALIPAWWSGSAARGALVGTTTTAVALMGFYVSLTVMMYGHLGATHGVTRSFQVVLEANRIWLVAGLVSGPVCGALAGLLGARRRTAWLIATLGLLLVGEIAVVLALRGVELPLLHLGWAASDWRAYEAEAALGLLTLGALGVRSVRLSR